MSVLKYARNAAAAAAAVFLPIHAAAAAPALPLDNIGRAAATIEQENDQFAAWNDFLVPAVIVIAVGLGLYFILEEDDSVSA